MATAEVTATEATIDVKIRQAQAKVKVIEDQISTAVQELADERNAYNSACVKLANGGNGDIERIRARMFTIESRIAGLKQTIVAPKAALDALIRERSEMVARQDQEDQARAIEEEGEFVANKIEAGLRAVAEREKQQTIINAIVGNLRTRSYLLQKNATNGKNGAARIENIASGISPERA